MGKLTILVVCLYSIFPFFSIAQEDHVWIFGNESGLDFNSEPPAVFKADSLGLSHECSASLCDVNGELVMYTNGTWLRNGNHEIMLNGSDLLGNTSTSQGALFVPKPGSSHIFYLFTLDNEGGSDGFCYSEINMNLNDGLGGITSNKNVNLLSEVGEQMAYTYHSNGTDIWVVVHSSVRDEFYSFLVTSLGVSFIPSITLGGTHSEYVIGSMTISPNGSKLAVAYKGSGTLSHPHGLDVFDFNRSTGNLSSPQQVTFNESDYGGYGVEFSPNSQLLYCSVRNVNSSVLYQFDLNTQQLLNSQLIIEDVNEARGLKRGPDGKIYIATQSNYLGIINNPNELGLDCNYSEMTLTDVPGISSKMGFPNIFTSDVITNVESIDESEELLFSHFPNPTLEHVTVSFDAQISFSLEIRNSIGQLIQSSEYQNTQSELILLPRDSGVYFLSVQTSNGKRYSARVIKEQ